MNKPKQPPSTQVRLWTDGSCYPNPGGPGGWAFILEHVGTGKRMEGSGHCASSTNNRMEVEALIEGLRALKRPCHVFWVTDSEYAITCLNVKTPKQWKKAKNKDLIQKLVGIIDTVGHVVVPEWVKGHDGHPENERCDQLALEARTILKVDFAA